MDDEIKSAFQLAMEKVEKMGAATEEERLRWKHVPEGEQLAAGYIKDGGNLLNEVNQYQGKARKYVVEGVLTVLVRNLNLPKNDVMKQRNKLAMEAIRALKTDKVAVENTYSKIRRIFNHFAEQGEQQRRQAYERLKIEFEAKMQQAVEQQLGPMARVRVDAEKQPQFQEEWRRVLGQLDGQYTKLLDEYKTELLKIA